ncbi:hypothetical protein ACQYAD_17755 [Neobacillus sp. SM06]|uniref:hypothetical protein n=1 Tax=Neobacillus sp. SM06 TaxID=3422492 RepID=UPI003D2AC085
MKKALKIIMWTFESFGNEGMQKAKQLHSSEMNGEQLFAEVNEYAGILKKCFYK